MGREGMVMEWRYYCSDDKKRDGMDGMVFVVIIPVAIQKRDGMGRDGMGWGGSGLKKTHQTHI